MHPEIQVCYTSGVALASWLLRQQPGVHEEYQTKLTVTEKKILNGEKESQLFYETSTEDDQRYDRDCRDEFHTYLISKVILANHGL